MGDIAADEKDKRFICLTEQHGHTQSTQCMTTLALCYFSFVFFYSLRDKSYSATGVEGVFSHQIKQQRHVVILRFLFVVVWIVED